MAAKTPEIDLRENYGKNYIINGDMRIAQRGDFFSAAPAVTFAADRFKYNKGSVASVHTVSQDTDVPTFAQAGYLFRNSLRLNLTTPDNAPGANASTQIQYIMEGNDWVNLAQKPFTISFWVKAALPGIYCLSVRNAAGDRVNVKEYVINSSNIWEKKALTFSAAPTSGTWDYTTGVGLFIRFVLYEGSTNQTAPSNDGVWLSGFNAAATTNQINGLQTGATDFRITGVMLNEGAEALPFRNFAGGDFQKELTACQRYFEKSYDVTTEPGTVTTVGVIRNANRNAINSAEVMVDFKVTKRISPSVTVYSPGTGNSGQIRNLSGSSDLAAAVFGTGPNGVSIATNAAGTDNIVYGAHFTANAEL